MSRRSLETGSTAGSAAPIASCSRSRTSNRLGSCVATSKCAKRSSSAARAEASARAAELERLAHFDVATQLPNRLLVRERLHDAIGAAEPAVEPVSSDLRDIDHMQVTVDT